VFAEVMVVHIKIDRLYRGSVVTMLIFLWIKLHSKLQMFLLHGSGGVKDFSYIQVNGIKKILIIV
jgi:hypothetical protein